MNAGQESVKNIQARSKKAFEEEAKWRDILEDCYQYCLPNRNLFSEQQSGAKKTDKIFDSTAVESINIGASKLQDSIAPIWKRWATLGPSAEVERLEGFKEVEKQIRDKQEENTKIMFDYINRSNFSSQFYEACLDLLIGTCTLAIEDSGEAENPIVFTAIPQKGVAFEEGADGTIKSHFRKHKVKARNIESMYRGFKPSKAVADIIEKNPDEDIRIEQAIIHNQSKNTYRGVVWVEGEDRYSWEEDYQDSNPWNTSRYTKVAGETRGRGVAMSVLSDIKTLNKIKEYSLQKAAIDLSGMWMATDDGVFNPYNFVVSPGIAMVVGSNDPRNPTLSRLDTGSDLNLVLFEVEALTARIRSAFFNDLRDPTGPVRSATEIAIESRDLAKRIGSAFGRLQTELLIPILSRVAWILQRRGIMQPIKIGGADLAVKFTSPLAIAQDIEDLMAVQQAVEFTMNTAGPEAVKMAFKTEDFGTWSGGKVNMPSELIRSTAEKAEVIKAGGEMAAQQMGMNNGVGQPES